LQDAVGAAPLVQVNKTLKTKGFQSRLRVLFWLSSQNRQALLQNQFPRASFVVPSIVAIFRGEKDHGAFGFLVMAFPVGDSFATKALHHL
jgi:hypothetical protein